MLKKLLVIVAFISVSMSSFATDLEEHLKSVVLIESTSITENGLRQSTGSGFYIEKNLIVTAFHVVENTVGFLLSTENGVRFKGTVVGHDPATDIAFIRTEVEGKPLKIQNETPKLGETVFVMGSPMGNLFSVSKGIVSKAVVYKPSIPFTRLIQTDAAMNHGASGGPIINEKGEVLGVVSFIMNPSMDGGSIGLNFGITSDIVSRLKASVENTGKVRRLTLGVKYFFSQDGIAIGQFTDTSKVKDYLKIGDVLKVINGTPLNKFEDSVFAFIIDRMDETVDIQVLRDKKLVTVKIPSKVLFE